MKYVFLQIKYKKSYTVILRMVRATELIDKIMVSSASKSNISIERLKIFFFVYEPYT